MLSHSISPVLFRIGFVQVTWYALVYIAGFLAALYILIKNKEEIGMSKEQIYDFLILGILGLIVGARIFHILFWGLDYYSDNLINIFYIWQGGFSFHGGLVGVFLTSWFYCRKKKINFWKIADLLALIGVLMPVFSRIANFINQEIVGTITNVPWCFNFNNEGICRHPVQLYASAGRFVFFGALIWLKKSVKNFKEGFIFWSSIFGVGLGRFFLDFLREDLRYFDLSAGQWFSLGMVFVGVVVLMKLYREGLREIVLKLRKL